MTLLGYSQEVDVSISVDSTKFRIGEQVEAVLQLNAPADSIVEWPIIKDTIGGVEVVERSLIDTLEHDDYLQMIQKIKLTQFDTGNFILSPIRFKVGSQIKYTKPIMFEVLGVKVDTTKQKLYDIKENIEVPYTFSDILPYLLFFLILLAIGYSLFRYLTRAKIEKTQEVYISPFETAMLSLKDLDDKKYLEAGNIKDYYDYLSDILRRFLEDEHGIAAMESTSDEIISFIKNGDFSPTIQMQIKELLVESDFVKFAKFKPDDNKHNYYRVMTEELIKATRVIINENTENDDE
jgi:hypothetical protein